MPDQTFSPSVDGNSSAGASRALPTILYAGLTAGAMDITAAIVHGGIRGSSPMRILQSVAGGLLGRDTFQGGLKTAVLGLALHFLIATTAAAVFFAASLKLPVLTRRAVVSGILYGIAVYLFMYMVVLPLSALQFRFFNQAATNILIGILIHIFCVGLPIALVVRRKMK